MAVDRLAALRRAMAERGADLVVVGPTANLRYLLGVQAIALPSSLSVARGPQ